MTNKQNLLTPPGYTKLVPLNKKRHQGMGVIHDKGLGAGLNSMFITFPEFFLASRDYPLVFVRLDLSQVSGAQEEAKEKARKKKKEKENGSRTDAVAFLPIVITGLKEGENRFVNTSGKWANGIYIPAYARQYPFYVISAKTKPDAAPERVICVDEEGLAKDGAPLFDADGHDSEPWKKMQTLINDMEKARAVTADFCKNLKSMDLFEPLETKLGQDKGPQYQLKSFYRINEKKLNDLPGDVLKDLMQKGALARIHAHLLSLDNFRRVMERPPNPVF